MASALFGSGPVRSKNLVEFKAGRMNLKGKMVHPDKRKGLVYVYQSEDSLMHFCWKDRSNGIVEDVCYHSLRDLFLFNINYSIVVLSFRLFLGPYDFPR